MKRKIKEEWLGCGAGEKSASPQPLSGGEGLNDFVVCEGRPPYKTSDRVLWEVLKPRARENRQTQTESERKMWQALRGSKLGHKIRRQHPIDVFIADFICVRKRVVIEIDGDYHLNPEQLQYDNQRTFILQQKGFKVIRFSNSEVENEFALVLNKLKALLDSIPDLDRDE